MKKLYIAILLVLCLLLISCKNVSSNLSAESTTTETKELVETSGKTPDNKLEEATQAAAATEFEEHQVDEPVPIMTQPATSEVEDGEEETEFEEPPLAENELPRM